MGEPVFFPDDQVRSLIQASEELASGNLEMRLRMDKGKPAEREDVAWTLCCGNPNQWLQLFTALRLKKGYELRGYSFYSMFGGRVSLWAVPMEAPLLHKLDTDNPYELKAVPKPPGAVDFFLDAVEGDGTPWSYLSASLLAREGISYGMYRHTCSSWCFKRILFEDPWGASANVQQSSEGIVWAVSVDSDSLRRRLSDRRLCLISERLTRNTISWMGLTDIVKAGLEKGKERDLETTEEFQYTRKDWTWFAEKPVIWRPRVQVTEESVTVTFFTYSGLHTETIYHHEDVFLPDNYRPVHVKITKLAEGPEGFIL